MTPDRRHGGTKCLQTSQFRKQLEIARKRPQPSQRWGFDSPRPLLITWRVDIAVYERDEALDYEQLALGDTEGRVLLIQRAFEFDFQDQEHGMDTYCLVDELQATHYGGVTAWSLAADALTLTLDADAAAVFGGDAFVLELGPEVERELVKHALTALLGS